jgi:hypothetical protein
MVEAHLFINQLVGSVVKYLFEVLYQELQRYIFSGLPSRVLESAVLPALIDLFLQWLHSVG